MKTVLTNDNGYSGLEGVNFPVELNARLITDSWIMVPKSELVKIGADGKYFTDGASYCFEFESEQGK